MALTVSLLGVNYSVPEPTDVSYDAGLTSYLKALATAFPQLNGGTASLTAELDFGASFGIKAAWYKSETANPASAGQVRLAKTDTANAADLALGIDTGDALTFGGVNVTGNPMLGANTAAAQSIPNGGVSTIVVFGTVERDSDSGYNSGTGRYTVPAGKGGDYFISAGVTWAAAATTPNIGVFKNAVAGGLKTLQILTAGTLTGEQSGATLVTLVAGDIIDIRAAHSSAGAVVL